MSGPLRHSLAGGVSLSFAPATLQRIGQLRARLETSPVRAAAVRTRVCPVKERRVLAVSSKGPALVF